MTHFKGEGVLSQKETFQNGETKEKKIEKIGQRKCDQKRNILITETSHSKDR